MSSNRQIIEKADFGQADLTIGGLLNPEQANKFIRKLITQPTIIRDARVVEMSAPTRNVNKISFNKRIMRSAVSADGGDLSRQLPYAAEVSTTAFDGSDAGSGGGTGEGDRRAKVQTSQIQLNTSEVIAEVHLSYDVIEDNIERGNVGQATDVGGSGAGGGLIDTVLTLMAERAALDFEELALLGEIAGVATDPYLGLQDGWLVRAAAGGQIVDFGSAKITKDLFRDGKKAMPDQYLRNLGQMKHYISMDQETEYRDTVASRGTGLGDSTLQGDADLRAFGSPISPVQQMPESEGIFVNPLNLLWGVQRKVLLEWEKEIRDRVLIMVLTARVALQVEETEAIVYYQNIGS